MIVLGYLNPRAYDGSQHIKNWLRCRSNCLKSYNKNITFNNNENKVILCKINFN